jgi:outer membrane protein
MPAAKKLAYRLCFVALSLSLAVTNAFAETLQQAWALAYENNPALQANRAQLRATDEQVSQALSNWRPSVDATGSIGRTDQQIPSLQPFGTADFAGTTRSYGIQATQPLFRGYRTISETKSAERQVLSERAKLREAEQQLFLDTASAYLGVIRDEAVLNMVRDNESVLEGKLDETKVRHKAGELTTTDIRQAESRLARAHVRRFQVEDSLTQDRSAYIRLVGTTPGTLQAPRLDPDPEEGLDQVFRLAAMQNPEVIASQFAVEQAKADIDFNKGSLLPEIDLVGNTGRIWGQSSLLPGEQNTSQALVQVTIPLYRTGADYSRTRAAEQVLTQREMELDDALRKVHESAMNAWQALKTAHDALDADATEVEAAASALAGIKEESKVGTRTTLDVLNAEQELLDAKIDEAKSRYDRDMAVLEIQAAIGQLTIEHLNLPVKAYDPRLHYDDVRNQWIGFSKDDSRYNPAPLPPTTQ